MSTDIVAVNRPDVYWLSSGLVIFWYFLIVLE